MQQETPNEKLLEESDVESSLPEHATPDPVTPVAAPVVTNEAPVVAVPTHQSENSGGVLVLQWLIYAFWGWFGASMVWLAGTVFTYFVTHSASVDWSQLLAYPLAAVIILFIIALVTDMLYRRREPAKKQGAANVIMLLHVVPFVLIAIGGLITFVFCLLTMMLNTSPVRAVDGPFIAMLTSLVGVAVYALIAIRIFFGAKKARVRLMTWGIFCATALALIIAAFAGPASDAIRTKQDRLIEQTLPTLSSDIRSYVAKNNKLPANLTDVTHSDSSSSAMVQEMLSKKLVTYKPNTLPATDGNSYSPEDTTSTKSGVSASIYPYNPKQSKRYYYQLCVTYKGEKKDSYTYRDTATMTTNGSAGVAADYRYDSVYSISSHPAGNVCYNLYAGDDSYYAY